MWFGWISFATILKDRFQLTPATSDYGITRVVAELLWWVEGLAVK